MNIVYCLYGIFQWKIELRKNKLNRRSFSNWKVHNRNWKGFLSLFFSTKHWRSLLWKAKRQSVLVSHQWDGSNILWKLEMCDFENAGKKIVKYNFFTFSRAETHSWYTHYMCFTPGPAYNIISAVQLWSQYPELPSNLVLLTWPAHPIISLSSPMLTF